jgi:alpha-1,2-rhamnosyltransferase
MQRGLPAIGSDIEVFREIGGEFMAYFDLDDPQSLANMVIDIERTGLFPASRNLDQWQWLSWRQASAQLVERIERRVEAVVVDRETACG